MKTQVKERNNFIILSGGPGSGKTSIIEKLSNKGYLCIDEVGRKIIQEQIAIGGNVLHSGDRIKFRDLMFTRSIEDYLRVGERENFVFFDRGIPELIGYSYLINEPVPDEYKKAASIFRYNKCVFIAPPWEEIYQKDSERKQDFQEAIDTYNAIKKSYSECDYELIELPKTNVLERVDFIISQLQKD
jgi:predicted ATPase